MLSFKMHFAVLGPLSVNSILSLPSVDMTSMLDDFSLAPGHNAGGNFCQALMLLCHLLCEFCQ